MPLQYINEPLGLPELQLQELVSIDTQEVHLRCIANVILEQSFPFCELEALVVCYSRNKLQDSAFKHI